MNRHHEEKMNLKGKKVLVVGLGKTGMACTRFLKEQEAEVTVSEAKPADQIQEELKKVERWMVKVETGGNREESFLDADLIVVSPGVPLNIPPLEKAKEEGKEIMSEIELTYRFCEHPIIAITGTNGKSTTTSLLGEIFRIAGRKVFVGGNLGNPMIEMFFAPEPVEYVIAEISSFQLEAITRFRPSTSILLNITPDHLDRYGTYQEYIDAKARIFINQEKDDHAILNYDDPECVKLSEEIKAQTGFFSTRKHLEIGCSVDGDYLSYQWGGVKEEYAIEDITLTGIHNYENIMAAIMAAKIYGLPTEAIRIALKQFKALEHRMELVKIVRGVKFYNDSKGTNVGAAARSLESFPSNIILIAGGKDKGGDYRILRKPAQGRLKSLILLGQAKEKIKEALGDMAPTYVVRDLDEAVVTAFKVSSPGDTVLFSPACSSFDMFRNFEERGEIFKNLVHHLQV
jgi:UDP-N-acetylmuramoylalanine--D-glutamate ligase